MSDFRFVVVVDLEDVADLEDAYAELHRRMSGEFPGQWESTDEAFEDGDEIPENVLVEARVNVLGRRPDYGQALDAIARHRRQIGVAPLDPVAAGWSEQDVIDEAERIRRLPNVAGRLMPPS